jgi:hypothetical protein
LSARLQQFFLVIELVVLLIFAGPALVEVGDGGGGPHPDDDPAGRT